MSVARQLSLDDICAWRHRGNPESVAANAQVEPTKEETRVRIYDFACARGDAGITTDEISEAWGLPPNRVSPRITELKVDGRLVPTDRRRKTRTGCSARVLVAAQNFLSETTAHLGGAELPHNRKTGNE
jgi:hypothetical protein